MCIYLWKKRLTTVNVIEEVFINKKIKTTLNTYEFKKNNK